MTPFMLSTHKSQNSDGLSLCTQICVYTFPEKVVGKPGWIKQLSLTDTGMLATCLKDTKPQILTRH